MSSTTVLDRRRLLVALLHAVGAATVSRAIGLPRRLGAQPALDPLWDVLVIGGGLAGLDARVLGSAPRIW